MEARNVEKSAILDVLDKQIIHALIVDARIAFARLGTILGVSEQTVARRYRSLRQRGIIHLSGQVNAVPLGHARWVLRIRSTPAQAVALAETLARFPDLSWVSLMSTGSEVICVSRPRSTERRDALLLRTLPQARQVVGLDAYEVIHRFPLTEDWPHYARLLTADQARELGPWRSPPDVGTDAPIELSKEDETMLTMLGRDGRAPYSQISAATGWPPTRVARRMAELVESGVLYFDLDFAIERMGYALRAMLWLNTKPAVLEATGRAIANHEEVAFVAATTGMTNLFVSLICRDIEHLYSYVTQRLGELDGIERIEVTRSLRAFKQAQTQMDSDRIKVAP